MLKPLAALAILALAACSPPAQDLPEPVASPAAEGVSVSSPAPNARVTSPLAVSGVAPANWYFENQFPLRLVTPDGQEIAVAAATPRVNWTEPGDKEFDAELRFEVTADTPAMLVLEEDMPRENETPRQLSIPVTLTPAG